MKINTISYIQRSLVAAVAMWGAATVMADHHQSKAGHHESKAGQHEQHGSKDVNFIKEAAKGGQAEIKLGKLAAEKAENSRVKQFAQQLFKDHSNANQDLMKIAQKHGVMLTTETAKQDEHAADKLEDKTGAEFDKAFIKHALKNHQKDITKYEKALENSEDAELRAYIKNTLPALREHLNMALNIGRTIGLEQSVLSSAEQFQTSSRSEGLGSAPGAESGQGRVGSQSDDHSPTERRTESHSDDQPDK